MNKLITKYVIVPVGLVVYICAGFGIRKMIDWLDSFHLMPSIFLEILGWVVIVAILILGYRALKYYYSNDQQ